MEKLNEERKAPSSFSEKLKERMSQALDELVDATREAARNDNPAGVNQRLSQAYKL